MTRNDIIKKYFPKSLKNAENKSFTWFFRVFKNEYEHFLKQLIAANYQLL